MNCDGIARWYCFLEYAAFGRALERRRLAFLDQLTDAHKVLILGDGDGRFTAQFLKSNPHAAVDSVDLSARMIELAKKRTSALKAEVQFSVGDARTFAFAGKYDLVITHFFLDCFEVTELAQVVERIAERCEPKSRWLISEFGLPEGRLRRFFAQILIRFMYFCFWLTTGLEVTHLPDYAAALNRVGFRVVEKRIALGGLVVSEIRRLG